MSTVRGRGRHSHIGSRGGAGVDHGQSIGAGTQGERNVEHQEGIQYREDCEKPSVSELTCRGGTRGLRTLVNRKEKKKTAASICKRMGLNFSYTSSGYKEGVAGKNY